jgi:UDP-glucose 4-epimerase
MTLLVTGGAGYIGSHMVLELLSRGEKVIVLDNLSTGFDWVVPEGVKLFIGETGNQSLVSAIIKAHEVESIIHFAASIVVPDSVSDPLSYYLNNTVNSRAMIESAVKGGVKNIIFSSTAAVYGTPDNAMISEQDRMNPESPYGMSKLMTEVMLRHASEAHGLKHVILRYFNVAGADPQLRTGQSSERATHLIKVAAEAVTGKRESMSIFGTDYNTPDGTCLRDYIHVSDLVKRILPHWIISDRTAQTALSIAAMARVIRFLRSSTWSRKSRGKPSPSRLKAAEPETPPVWLPTIHSSARH